MRAMSSTEAKYNFGLLLDTARAGPVTIKKHGRAVVVVLAVEEYDRLNAMGVESRANKGRSQTKE